MNNLSISKNIKIIILILTTLIFSSKVFSDEKNITYMQILQKPNDLDLNLKYAQQQGKIGNHKQTIATLERLNMIYPDNIEIKLYLLSVLVQADSPDKALTIIDEIKKNEDVTEDDLLTVFQAGDQVGIGPSSLNEIIAHLEETYCQSIGIEYQYIRHPERVEWIRKHIELKNRPQFSHDVSSMFNRFLILKIDQKMMENKEES